jgi:hypothetical protein
VELLFVKKSQSRIWLVVSVIAGLLFVGILVNPRFDYQSLQLEQLIIAIEAGEVKEIIVVNDTEVNAIFEDGSRMRTTKPADMELLAEVNLPPDLDRAILYREENNPLGAVFRAGALIVLPLVALTALYLFYINRVNAAKAAAS